MIDKDQKLEARLRRRLKRFDLYLEKGHGAKAVLMAWHVRDPWQDDLSVLIVHPAPTRIRLKTIEGWLDEQEAALLEGARPQTVLDARVAEEATRIDAEWADFGRAEAN
jgi:hypothetical protein